MWPAYLWSIRDKDGIYLTFDDGPIPEVTPWVMDQLDRTQAKATFFCIGKNIQRNPDIFQELIERGHSVGNHTFSHLNGRRTQLEHYLQDTVTAQAEIDQHHQVDKLLFRPPYGRIRKKQAMRLKALGYQIVMWDLLSGDFDPKQDVEFCWDQVKKNLAPGSIVVMHDSHKDRKKLEYILPRTLEHIANKGWKCRAIG